MLSRGDSINIQGTAAGNHLFEQTALVRERRQNLSTLSQIVRMGRMACIEPGDLLVFVNCLRDRAVAVSDVICENKSSKEVRSPLNAVVCLYPGTAPMDSVRCSTDG